jgi:hypothetical protein
LPFCFCLLKSLFQVGMRRVEILLQLNVLLHLFMEILNLVLLVFNVSFFFFQFRFHFFMRLLKLSVLGFRILQMVIQLLDFILVYLVQLKH